MLGFTIDTRLLKNHKFIWFLTKFVSNIPAACRYVGIPIYIVLLKADLYTTENKYKN